MILEPCQSSGLKTSSAAIAGRSAALHSVTLLPGSDANSIIVYDNASAASGKILAQINGLANAKSETIIFKHPVAANLGLYCAVSGTSAAYVISYTPLSAKEDV